jgi:7-cyano-7-deazaguanine synthase in queuosine biosynthesis
MELVYNLKPTNFKYVIATHFPQVPDNKKVGIFISGGMESTLVATLAFEIYGKDNVICFYSDSIFSSNNNSVDSYIKSNIKNAEKILDTTAVYLKFDYSLHITNRYKSASIMIEHLKLEYNIGFTLWGFTNLFFLLEPFKDPSTTMEYVKKIVYSDIEKYKTFIEEFHLPTNAFGDQVLQIDISPDVYPLILSNDFIKLPFGDLNKSEVLDLYRQLDKLDLVQKTRSCIRETIANTGKHCGECFNCQQRWDAFKILNDPRVVDNTEYKSDIIKIRRKELENVIHT